MDDRELATRLQNIEDKLNELYELLTEEIPEEEITQESLDKEKEMHLRNAGWKEEEIEQEMVKKNIAEKKYNNVKFRVKGEVE